MTKYWLIWRNFEDVQMRGYFDTLGAAQRGPLAGRPGGPDYILSVVDGVPKQVWICLDADGNWGEPAAFENQL